MHYALETNNNNGGGEKGGDGEVGANEVIKNK